MGNKRFAGSSVMHPGLVLYVSLTEDSRSVSVHHLDGIQHTGDLQTWFPTVRKASEPPRYYIESNADVGFLMARRSPYRAYCPERIPAAGYAAVIWRAGKPPAQPWFPARVEKRPGRLD